MRRRRIEPTQLKQIAGRTGRAASRYRAAGAVTTLRDDVRELVVATLEAPLALKDHSDWVDYSYINHYVCNGAVICPSFDDPRDDAARERLEDAYPGRDIRMLDARALFAMGGGIHCITQQQPSGVG